MTRAAVRVIGLMLAIAGCGCTIKGGSTYDVKRVNGSTFEVSAHVIGSLSGATEIQAKNEEIATTFCAEKGKPMTIVDRRGFGGVAPQDILTFRCAGPVAVGQRPSKPTSGT